MKAADMPRVYAIILNWNKYEDTKNCLESLQQATYPNLKIIVVDNGSADGSGKRLQQEFLSIGSFSMRRIWDSPEVVIAGFELHWKTKNANMCFC